MRIKYEQKFHPIGQGLFYSSSLQLDEISANVIFDCGSENIELINNEIDQYGNKDIDILIISHLHYDHVSGLEYLLMNRIVNTVILPYLFPEERLLLWLFNHNKPDWYKRFLTNPYSYLNEKKKVKKIIIINGDNDNNDYSVGFLDEFPPLNDNLIKEKNIQIKLDNVSQDIREQIQKTENIEFDDKKFFLKKDKGYISISQLFLAFFNYKIKKNEKFNRFIEEIEKLGINNTESKLTQLQNKKKQELIRKSYEILAKDLNITSLAAYQGFVFPFKKRERFIYVCRKNDCQDVFINNLYCDCFDCFVDAYFRCRFINKYKIYFDCFCNCHINCIKMIGTLLLGDIKLDYKIKKKKEMFVHFKKLLPSVRLVQLSHHGSKNGWNDRLISEIPSNSTYIASHGATNKYKHPHKEIVLKLAENNRKFISVTEKNAYSNSLEFVYFIKGVRNKK